MTWPNRGLACSECGGNFLAAVATPSHPQAIRIQAQIDDALSRGWIQWEGTGLQPLAFLQGLRFLAFGLTTNRHAELRREISRTSPGLELPSGVELELMRVGPRRMVVRALARWLQHWPALPLMDIENSKTHVSTFRQSRVAPPFWVDQALELHPSAQTRKVSQTEVDAAVSWLKAKAAEVTRNSLQQSLGLGPT